VRRLSLSSRHTMQSAAGAICSRPQTRCGAYRLGVAEMQTRGSRSFEQARKPTLPASAQGPKAPRGIKQGLAREDSTISQKRWWRCEKLCIRAEILTDMPTSSRRSGIYAASINAALSTMAWPGHPLDNAMDTMAFEWVGVGPPKSHLLHLLENSSPTALVDGRRRSEGIAGALSSR